MIARCDSGYKPAPVSAALMRISSDSKLQSSPDLANSGQSTCSRISSNPDLANSGQTTCSSISSNPDLANSGQTTWPCLAETPGVLELKVPRSPSDSGARPHRPPHLAEARRPCPPRRGDAPAARGQGWTPFLGRLLRLASQADTAASVCRRLCKVKIRGGGTQKSLRGRHC